MLPGVRMKSTIRVFRVLETLCEGKSAGVSELSSQLDIKPSSMHRFLSVLTELGYVEKSEQTGKYFATLKVFQLGVSVRNKLSLISIARPYMGGLCETMQETVNIAIFSENSVVVIDRMQSLETHRTNIVVGRHLPAYCTALGKIYLADMFDSELDQYLENVELKPLTRKTITDHEALRKALIKIRNDGYAMDNCELDENVRCLAGPIRDESGKLVAAISISGPIARLKMVRLKTFTNTIIDITQEISRKMGYRKDFPANRNQSQSTCR
jgi:DNA-binding IclR family transcriptional regulator